MPGIVAYSIPLVSTTTTSSISTTEFFSSSSAVSDIWPSWNNSYIQVVQQFAGQPDTPRVRAELQQALVAGGTSNAYAFVESSQTTAECAGNVVTTITWRVWNWNNSYSPITTLTPLGMPATTGTASDVWTAWNGGILVRRTTEEERQRRQVQEETWAQRQEEATKKRREADQKAEQILLANLDEQQKRELSQKGHFHLYVGDKKYRIKRGRSGNVELVDTTSEKALHRYCAHPAPQIPDADTMLAQKLLIETDEPAFLRVANRHF